MNIHEDSSLFDEVVDAAALWKGIRPVYIEKDYWVCNNPPWGQGLHGRCPRAFLAHEEETNPSGRVFPEISPEHLILSGQYDY